MNRVKEAHEGIAKPSVWPVYLLSAIIGLFSLSFLSWVWFVPSMAQIPAEVYQELSPGAQQFGHLMQQLSSYALLFGLYGVFGTVAAVGAGLLRSWGWWCVIVWLAMYALWHLLLVISMGMTMVSPAATFITVAVYALIVWPLATRRGLFFPGT